MKGSKLMAFLLFLLLLVGTSQGIRFEEELIAAFRRIAHKEDGFFGEGESVGVPCEDPALCSGRSRIVLMEKAIAKSKSEWKASGDHSEEVQEHNHTTQANPDVMDISGMDYSPAKRKPPIHN